MTTILHERINGLYDPADDSNVQTNPEIAVQSDRALTPQEKLAKDAVTRLFNDLKDSPNNKDYLSSDAYKVPYNWLTEHTPEIEQDVLARLGSLSMDNVSADVAALWRLKYNSKSYAPNDQGGFSFLPKSSEASDFMYAGIKDIVAPVINRFDRGDDTVEEINGQTVRALGATMVRSYYLQELSWRQPEYLTPQDLKHVEYTYRQNTLSHIRVAARIENQAEQQGRLATVHQFPTAETEALSRTA